MKFIPLGKAGTPLLSYKEHPEIITEDREWIPEAVEQGYGCGVYLDNSGLVVIDTDSGLSIGTKIREEYGWEYFQDVCKELGLSGIPRTFTVQTRTPGHFHFYFRQNAEYPLSRTSIHSQIPQVDVKVTGYVKSWHCAGYQVVRKIPAIIMPDELAQYLYRPTRVPSGIVYDGERGMTEDFAEYLLARLSSTGDGERNHALYKTAAMFSDSGLTDNLSRSKLVHAAVRAGLSQHEAARTIDSAWGVQ